MAAGLPTLPDKMKTATAPTGQAAPPDSRRWWTLSVLCLSLLMVVVGNTALNVAIPTLVRDIHATDTQLQWIVDAYSLVFAGLLLTCGAVFFINLPVIAVALIGRKFLVPTSRDPNRIPLDPVGSVLTIVGLASLLYGIIEAPIRGWSDARTMASFALAIVVLGEFAIW